MSHPKHANAPHEPPSAAEAEATFLAQQAAMARKAIGEALADLGHDLGHGVDPRTWIKSHPWVTLATAAAAGFAAATAVAPSKQQQQTLDKLHKIEEALRHGPRPGENGNGRADANKTGPGLFTTLFHEAFSLFKPALISMLTSQLAGNHSQPPHKPSEEEANGTGAVK